MKRSVLTVLLLLVLAAPAAGAPRSGTTSEGVRLSYSARAVTFVPPASGRAEVRCDAGRESVGAFRAVRGGRRVTIALPAPRFVPEWCAFVIENGDGQARRRGAATLLPRVAPAPPPVVAAPGVRTGEDRQAGATFLLQGRRLTVRLATPLRRSLVVALICADFRDEATAAVARIAVGRGRRVLTAELAGGDVVAARSCLLEDSLFGGADLAGADLAPVP